MQRVCALLACSALLSACFGDSPESRIASGKKYLEKNDAAAAVIEFKSALQKNDQSAEARLLLGKALLSNSEPVAATIELNKARALKISDDEVVPLLARASLLSGEPKKVVELYSDVQLSGPAANADLKSTIA